MTDIDWRKLWIERDVMRKEPDNVGYWNERAREFSNYHKPDSVSRYAEVFMEYLRLLPGESVFDMGCGNGGLAVPLARAGHPVFACDFSPKMLEVMTGYCAETAITGVLTRQLSWTDDWEACGITEKSVDVAIASRSIIVRDLWLAFERLNRVARRKVAATLATDLGPRATHSLGDTVEGISFLPDYIYGLNILFAMGYHPELRYINSLKKEDDNTLRPIKWAFISWDV
ncbi:MAG: methyltransferase domain-containing protein [Coriobacteriia bacterium]|nr:methyltransferase domain-containing protein [Coriobacteriia bacterium]